MEGIRHHLYPAQAGRWRHTTQLPLTRELPHVVVVAPHEHERAAFLFGLLQLAIESHQGQREPGRLQADACRKLRNPGGSVVGLRHWRRRDDDHGVGIVGDLIAIVIGQQSIPGAEQLRQIEGTPANGCAIRAAWRPRWTRATGLARLARLESLRHDTRRIENAARDPSTRQRYIDTAIAEAHHETTNTGVVEAVGIQAL